MQVPVHNTAGDQVGTVELPADIFEVEVNRGLMHQAYVRQMANARLGTGRARHGSRNAPIFVGGGVAHGPRPRDYSKQMPRKMRRQALRCALSALAADNQIVVVDEFTMDTPKTREMRDTLGRLVGEQSALILVAERNEALEKSVRNLSNARTLRANYLNVRELLSHDRRIIPPRAL